MKKTSKLLTAGLFLVISGFINFGNEINSGFEMGQEGINPGNIFSSFGGFAIGGFLIVPGIFFVAIGFIVRVMIGNRREIISYTTQQVMPVAEESIEKIAPTVGSAVGTLGKELAKGIKEGLKEDINNKD